MAPYTEEYLMGEKKDQGMKVFETESTHGPWEKTEIMVPLR